jgi:xanthine dehydrogenase small subunit
VPSGNHPTVALVVDGHALVVPDDGGSLLDALRDHAGVRSAKDGCSPQGQCGCCTVLVDGQARVACVTPVRRVAGRTITTAAALPDAGRWADALCATGGSQCGFCTPGIAVRLSALAASGRSPGDEAGGVTGIAGCERALLAHLCRCTGWQPIVDAWRLATGPGEIDPWEGRDPDAAVSRATIEGGVPQAVGPGVALGGAPFAADTAPPDALVAVPDGRGDWSVGETLAEARAAAGKVQGRRTTVAVEPPLALPDGDWATTLRTSWVEPAYLETDASWCAPGGEPATPLANGGAFGAKVTSAVPGVARMLADRHGRAVRVLLSREDTVRMGPKRPPMAAGIRPDGSGVVRAVDTPGLADVLAAVAPELVLEAVALAGPPTSVDIRAAGWAEVALLRAGLAGAAGPVRSPDGAEAEASVADGRMSVRVRCGDPLDEVVLRSFCTGAAHMALGWVTSEGLAVDADGTVHDLTIRSFGIVRAADTPVIEVDIEPDTGPPVNGSDAVFAAVAAALWVARGCPTDLPDTVRGRRGG